MANVTYLLGAGASAEVLPCIKDIPDRIGAFYTFMNNHLENIEGSISGVFLNECNDLVQKAKMHNSVDTYAKKLFITQSSRYELVKSLLSCFFVYEQLLTNADKRYDAFIASLVSRDRKMPENVKILSWNYDFQFEKAFSQFSEKDDIYENQIQLQVISNKNSLTYSGGFGLFKINGTAEFVDPDRPGLHNGLYKNINEFKAENVARRLLSNFRLCINEDKLVNSLSFAWEDSYNSATVNSALEAIKGTEVLIIIGYSFPFFNRTVDRALLQAMPNLHTVYIQDPQPENAMDSFTSVAGRASTIIPIPIRYVGAFHLPPQL